MCVCWTVILIFTLNAHPISLKFCVTFSALLAFVYFNIYRAHYIISGILRYQVNFQTLENVDELGEDFDLDDY